MIGLLEHPKELVRKKAVMCLQRFYHKDPSSVADGFHTHLRRMLCDKVRKCRHPYIFVELKSLGNAMNDSPGFFAF